MAFWMNNDVSTPQPDRGRARVARPSEAGGLRRLLFGRPIRTEHDEHVRLPKVIALPVFSSDAISSVAYATQEILLVLGAAGLWMAHYRALYSELTIGITLGIVVLLLVVVASYRQTIFAYPSGGGSYIVSRENLGVFPGLIAAAAVLVDYLLTVSVSVAAGVQNILSAVIEQLSGAVFRRTGPVWRVTLYDAMQVAAMLILVVAAYTSFAGFPRLAAVLARDRFMPRQLTNLGDKLVFTNGIILLALFAMALVVAFYGSVDRLIPLCAVGVFTAFTLSQCGTVIHWRRDREGSHIGKILVNGLGAMCTCVVLSAIIHEKAHGGAWVVIVVGALLIAMFRGIWKHYAFLRSQLTIIGYNPRRSQLTNTVLVLIPSLHRGVFPALDYARSLSPDCRGIHIEVNPEDTPRLRREWEQLVGDDLPLVILPSPYRSLVGPLLSYLEEAQRQRDGHIVTVVVPEFVPGKWWHAVLHNANGFLVKYHLSHRPGVIVTNVRYFLNGEQSPTSIGLGGDAPGIRASTR